MSSSATIPFVPPRLPGDLLGTWLDRCAMFSGKGAWRPLLLRAGFNPDKSLTAFFDLVDFDSGVETLLNGVGIAYPEALSNLTTVKYWVALAGGEGRIAGAPQFRMPVGGVGLTYKYLHKILNTGPAASLTKRWFCPDCLTEDVERYGFAYLRRAHQLVTVCYCPTHWTPLLHRCAACGAGLTGALRKANGMLTKQCHCGFDLRRHGKAPRIPEALKQLVTVSVDAMELKDIDWDVRAVRGVIRQAQFGRFGWNKRTRSDLLLDAFGGGHAGKFSVWVEPPGAQRRLVFSTVMPTAPTCAALLAAMGMKIESTVPLFRDWRDVEIRGPRVASQALTVPSARQVVTERMKAHPGRSPAQCGAVYWFLRIYDPEWIVAQGHSRRKPDPLPSIAEDRRRIAKGLGDVMTKPDPKVVAALLRTRFRDLAWLRDLYERRRILRVERMRKDRAKLARKRKAAIKTAIALITGASGRPRLLTYGLLAKQAGLAYTLVYEAIRDSDVLRSSIERWNRQKIRRQLKWAVEELRAQDETLTQKSVFKKAGLPSTPELAAYVGTLIPPAMQLSRIPRMRG